MTRNDHLRALAQAATPGPWKQGGLEKDMYGDTFDYSAFVEGPDETTIVRPGSINANAVADAAFIAAFNPQKALELLNDLDGLRDALNSLIELVETDPEANTPSCDLWVAIEQARFALNPERYPYGKPGKLRWQRPQQDQGESE